MCPSTSFRLVCRLLVADCARRLCSSSAPVAAHHPMPANPCLYIDITRPACPCIRLAGVFWDRPCGSFSRHAAAPTNASSSAINRSYRPQAHTSLHQHPSTPISKRLGPVTTTPPPSTALLSVPTNTQTLFALTTTPSPAMPSATGQNWEKYQKKFADEEEEEKKIVPLSEECVCPASTVVSWKLTARHPVISRFSRPTVRRRMLPA